MNKRVTIQSLTRESDGQGGFTETWSDIGTVWASLKPVKAYERFQAQQMASPTTHDIMMRYRRDVTTECRLIYQGRIFGVKEAINVDEDSRFLSIKAIESGTLEYVPEIGAILLRDGGYLTLRDGGFILLRG